MSFQIRQRIQAHEPDAADAEHRGRSQAAVLVPLIADESEPQILLTERAGSLVSHGGEVAFPGGKVDEDDDTDNDNNDVGSDDNDNLESSADRLERQRPRLQDEAVTRIRKSVKVLQSAIDSCGTGGESSAARFSSKAD